MSTSSHNPRGPAAFDAYYTRILRHLVPFSSTDGRAFVRLPAQSDDGFLHFPVRSPDFRSWLYARAFSEFNSIPTSHAFSALCLHLEAQAANAHPALSGISVPRRVDSRPPGPAPQKLFLDLAAPHGRFVEITPHGWSIAASEEVPFETSRSAFPLPIPQPPDPAATDSPLDLLRSTLNLGPADSPDWLRCLAWLLNSLRSTGPFPILILRGPSGCGKSLAGRVLRFMIDPSSSPFLPLPASARDLLSLAAHNWILAFDHVSALTPNLCDALCRLTSGAGLTLREPGRSDPTQRWIKRPILLTVTDGFTPPPDLAARALTVTLPDLTPDSRRTEADLIDVINRSQAHIVGALCDALSTILANPPQPGAPCTTRHSGALAWALAAVPALGCTAAQMRDAFDRNPIPTSPIVDAVSEFLRDKSHWTGTPTELFELLPPCGPANPQALSAALTRHAVRLADAGITVSRDRTHASRNIELRAAIASRPSAPSTQPPSPQPDTATPEIPPTPANCVTPAGGVGLQVYSSMTSFTHRSHDIPYR